jgi:hypothetical protein
MLTARLNEKHAAAAGSSPGPGTGARPILGLPIWALEPDG